MFVSFSFFDIRVLYILGQSSINIIIIIRWSKNFDYRETKWTAGWIFPEEKFLWHRQVSEDSSIDSVLFNGLDNPGTLPLSIVDLYLLPRHIHGFLGSPESILILVSRSVQPSFQGLQMWPTDRQTDHATPSVAIGRI